MARNKSSDDPLDLLTEWMTWWENSDVAPAKMPDALHVRTAIVLLAERNWHPKDLSVSEGTG